jgi:prepilin-type N-terminal cleavage/methylation domain-containing protein
MARQLHSQDGMTLIEVLVAMLVLTIGILGMMGMFDGARKLTLIAERRESITHLAQRELERLQSVPYSELAMATAPAHEAVPTPPASDTPAQAKEAEENFIHEHPDYYVDYPKAVKCEEVKGGGCFAWNATKPEETEEAIAVAEEGKGKCATSGTVVPGCGVVSASPVGVSCSEVNPFGACEWTDGRLSGDVYDFITYHKDPACKETTPGQCITSYKRATVVVTVKVPAGQRVPAPVRVSTLIPNPLASRENPLSAATKCTNNETKVEESCTQALSKGVARTWFLHDIEAEAVEKSSFEAAEKIIEEAKGHNTHPTVGPAPAHPDLMDTTPATRTALYDYSEDQDFQGFTYGAIEHGGRRLAKNEVGCSSESELLAKELSTKAAEGEMWVTSPLSIEYKLNGAGALTVYTQTMNGAESASPVTLCLGVYDVPEKIEKLWSTLETTPKLIGYAKYSSSMASPWPTKMSSLEFVFALKFIKEDQIVPEKHRLGFRLWSNNEPISIAYDTALQSSVLQLNTE